MTDRVNVRRFTAMDMHGLAGSTRRRRIILVEFVVGCPLLVLVAVLTLRTGDAWLGLIFLGIALNYLPLMLHALALFPPGRLEAELAGVDVPRELKRDGLLQFALFVPFLVALAAAAQELTREHR